MTAFVIVRLSIILDIWSDNAAAAPGFTQTSVSYNSLDNVTALEMAPCFSYFQDFLSRSQANKLLIYNLYVLLPTGCAQNHSLETFATLSEHFYLGSLGETFIRRRS